MALRNQSMLPTYSEVIPRDYEKRPVGTIPNVPAVASGDEYGAPDMLVPKAEYKDAIDFASEFQVFPSFAQKASWAPDGFRYNQNGLGYCWTWGGTACCMDLQQIHCVDVIPLAPVSMGYLVGWANRGNYLESYIGGAREQGVCAAIDGNINDHRNSRNVWSDQERPVKLDKVWDIDTRSSKEKALQGLLSCLVYGCPVYIAYNWWGHALEMVAIAWDQTKPYDVVFVIRNSHNESDFILLEGSRGIPDEMYAFVSLKLSD
jgi:hypothetical protein